MDRVDYESLIIQDLLNFHRDKSLNINPWYQRRSVWLEPQKAYLINTIFEKKPVPSIYVRHQIDVDAEKSINEVVDGQQRIRTIISYREDGFAARHPEHKKKVKYSDLTKAQREDFVATKLSVGYLIGAEEQDVIDIFGRINSISKTLNPQEKRNALYSGDFKQFTLRQAADRLPFWRSTSIFSASDISRMQEVQFVSDLVINMINGLSDFDAKAIDRFYKQKDEDFAEVDDISSRMESLFSKLIEMPEQAFKDTVFRQYQLAFSLMIVVDRMRQQNPSPEAIERVMRDIDARVSAYQELDVKTEDQSRFLEGFSGGNLHRIKTRTIRDQAITAAFQMPSLHRDYADFRAETARPNRLLASTANIAPAHIKYIAEIALLRLAILIENSLKAVFCKLLCGADFIDGTSPILLLPAQKHAPAAVDAMKKYGRVKPRPGLPWNDGKEIRDNICMLIDRADNCYAEIIKHSSFMTEIRSIRNHIAHRNNGTRKNFVKIIRKYYGANVRGVTCGNLLVSPRVSSHRTLIEKHIISAIVMMKDVVRGGKNIGKGG